MHKLPTYILVVSIIRYTDNAELVDVIKDYLSGVLHIDITDYKSNKQTVQYIVCDSHIIKKFVHTLYVMRDRFKILDYSYYVLNEHHTTYHRRYIYAPYSMPDEIAVDSIITEVQLWYAV